MWDGEERGGDQEDTEEERNKGKKKKKRKEEKWIWTRMSHLKITSILAAENTPKCSKRERDNG